MNRVWGKGAGTPFPWVPTEKNTGFCRSITYCMHNFAYVSVYLSMLVSLGKTSAAYGIGWGIRFLWVPCMYSISSWGEDEVWDDLTRTAVGVTDWRGLSCPMSSCTHHIPVHRPPPTHIVLPWVSIRRWSLTVTRERNVQRVDYIWSADDSPINCTCNYRPIIFSHSFR